jgi:hypothetical protein
MSMVCIHNIYSLGREKVISHEVCAFGSLNRSEGHTWLSLVVCFYQSDNKDSRGNRPNCITADERIVENFRKFLPGETEKYLNWNIEMVCKLSGILDVNAHSFPVKVDGEVVA